MIGWSIRSSCDVILQAEAENLGLMLGRMICLDWSTIRSDLRIGEFILRAASGWSRFKI